LPKISRVKEVMKQSKEPESLKRGKRFHKLIQEEWLRTSIDGTPRPERSIKKASGKKGRVDILVEELGDGFVSIIEIKTSDWDIMTEKNVMRNVRRQIRQVWGYVNSQLDVYGRQVCPGIIFPKLPKDTERLNLIESMFNSEGIQVVWHDETMDQLKRRSMTNLKPHF
jgi:hypothetical protein